jgi:nitrogen fixation protein NifB
MESNIANPVLDPRPVASDFRSERNSGNQCSAFSPSVIQPLDFSKHPCFSREAHGKFARVHLPVAPRCNLQCNFCNRKFDCMNESRPGVTSSVLPPGQAVPYLEEVFARVKNLSVIGIAGPGDPFANSEETMTTLRSVRARFPEMMLCLATNGLGVAPYVEEIAALKVSHVTFTVNAVDPAIGAKIYAWIRDGRRPLRGVDAAKLLLERQLDGIRRLKELGVVVKINSILMPGINDTHIPEVAKVMKELGADLMNVMAFLPVKGAAFEDLAPPDNLELSRVRLQSGLHLPQMTHCARCRADAVGLISEGLNQEDMERLNRFAHADVLGGRHRPFVAVASEEGALVNQHLGEAARVLVFRQDPSTPSGFKFHEVRRTPEPGSGEHRWRDLAAILHDCRAILVSAAGPKPKSIIEACGVEVLEMEGLIEEGLAAVFSDQPIPKTLQRRFTACGAGCKGTGTGCG